ncbi:MAG: hypothetical protein JW807_15260 [Spirochaetes bacterium]|nr:hypothetical protein [Spirochaetota bacterium]
MKIHVFSNGKTISKNFGGLIKAKKNELKISPPGELKKSLKGLPAGSLVYADVSSFKKTEVPALLKLLAKNEKLLYGIIDPAGTIADIAELFHNGACDYLDAGMLKKGVQQKRLDQIMRFKNIEAPDRAAKAAKKNYILSGNDWKGVQKGKEYTFTFMFIELDNKSDLKAMGPEQFKKVTATFRQYIEESVAPLKGKIWIWMDFGGLVIFPFDGKNYSAIEAAMKAIINRKLMSAELIYHDINLSYRIALHIGNTVYQSSGETGEIVSDTINSIFHLGQKFAEPGGLYMTDDIFILTPSGMMNFFVPAGEYEGRNIFKMRRII